MNDKTLTQILDLAQFEVDGYRVEQDAEQDILHLYCQVTVEAAVCLYSKSVTVDIKERQECCVCDVDWSGKRTYTHFAALFHRP